MLVLGICLSLRMSGYHRAARLLVILLGLLSGLLPLVTVHHAPLEPLDPTHQSVLVQSTQVIVGPLSRERVFDQASRCRDEDEAVSGAVDVLVVGAERGARHLQVGVGGARHEPEPDA